MNDEFRCDEWCFDNLPIDDAAHLLQSFLRCLQSIHDWLVVDLPLWKVMEFVSWDDSSHILWKNKTCSKPPTRWDKIIPKQESL